MVKCNILLPEHLIFNQQMLSDADKKEGTSMRGDSSQTSKTSPMSRRTSKCSLVTRREVQSFAAKIQKTALNSCFLDINSLQMKDLFRRSLTGLLLTCSNY